MHHSASPLPAIVASLDSRQPGSQARFHVMFEHRGTVKRVGLLMR